MDRRLGSKEGALEVKSHEFFTGICWDRVLKRDYEPPFVPCLSSADDVSNFDTRFTSKSPRESDDLGSHRNNTQGKFFLPLMLRKRKRAASWDHFFVVVCRS